MPGLQAKSLVGACERQAHIDVSPCLSPSLPLCLKINNKILKKKRPQAQGSFPTLDLCTCRSICLGSSPTTPFQNARQMAHPWEESPQQPSRPSPSPHTPVLSGLPSLSSLCDCFGLWPFLTQSPQGSPMTPGQTSWAWHSNDPAFTYPSRPVSLSACQLYCAASLQQNASFARGSYCLKCHTHPHLFQLLYHGPSHSESGVIRGVLSLEVGSHLSEWTGPLFGASPEPSAQRWLRSFPVTCVSGALGGGVSGGGWGE